VFLGSIAESDSAYCVMLPLHGLYHCMVCPSVCMSSVTLMHLLKPLDGMRCHLARTCVVPSNIVVDRSPCFFAPGDLGGKNH